MAVIKFIANGVSLDILRTLISTLTSGTLLTGSHDYRILSRLVSTLKFALNREIEEAFESFDLFGLDPLTSSRRSSQYCCCGTGYRSWQKAFVPTMLFRIGDRQGL